MSFTFEAEANTKPSAPGARVLVADDEPLARFSMKRCLAGAGYDVVVAEDGRQAMDLMSDDIAIAMLDLQMPRASGLECLRFARERFPDMQVMMISGADDLRAAVEAMKEGAVEYITKPFNPEELLAHTAQAIRNGSLVKENRSLRAAVGQAPQTSKWTAQSDGAKRVHQQAKKVARLDSTILITGESGTGKTTIARMIHNSGKRADSPFVAVNCASLPRDLIESELFGHKKGAFTGATEDRPGRAEIADGGTLFLDEIGDLPLELQPKLLTFLQDKTVQRVGSNDVRTVDVRVIAATHQDLATMCQQNRFRQDLYYRLNVLNIGMPSLSERRADIPSLANAVLQRISGQLGLPICFDADAIAQLVSHSWPGNIRELENVIERAAAFCEDNTIRNADIQIDSNTSDAMVQSELTSLADMTLVEIETKAIVDTLEACDGNKARTARSLGISEKSIYNKMKRLGLR
jgi:DNA-binding NtrC family response regulator